MRYARRNLHDPRPATQAGGPELAAEVSPSAATPQTRARFSGASGTSLSESAWHPERRGGASWKVSGAESWAEDFAGVTLDDRPQPPSGEGEKWRRVSRGDFAAAGIAIVASGGSLPEDQETPRGPRGHGHMATSAAYPSADTGDSAEERVDLNG